MEGILEYFEREYPDLHIRDVIECDEPMSLNELSKEYCKKQLMLGGVSKSFCECGSQKDHDCKYCTSCNRFHSV